ncbi:PQQ-binding-like beta-propeller repeat protein [bacterium]|nr:PQQ-binding-like beta-propeller repeat protein [bacterium]
MILTALLASACGGSSRHEADLDNSAEAGRPAVPGSMAELQAQLDALSRPENISAAHWDELKSSLASALQEQGSLTRTASIYPYAAPRGNPQLTSGLKAEKLPSGQTGFYWDYPCQGDYDQNQHVSFRDLTTIGITYLRSYLDEDWDRYRAADGNADGAVNNGDLVPLMINFDAFFSGCVLEYADTADAAVWSTMADVSFSDSVDPGYLTPRQFQTALSFAPGGWYRLRGYNEYGGQVRRYGSPWKAIHVEGGPPGQNPEVSGWYVRGGNAEQDYYSKAPGPDSISGVESRRFGRGYQTAVWVKDTSRTLAQRDDGFFELLDQNGARVWTSDIAVSDRLYAARLLPDGGHSALLFEHGSLSQLRFSPSGVVTSVGQHELDGESAPLLGSAGRLLLSHDAQDHNGMDSLLESYDADGQLDWSVSFSEDFIGNPLLTPDGRCVVLARDEYAVSTLYCLDALGAQLWSFSEPDWLFGSTKLPPLWVGFDGRVFTGIDGDLFCFEPDGNVAWTNENFGNFIYAVVASDGRFYNYSPLGTNRQLEVLDSDGSRLPDIALFSTAKMIGSLDWLGLSSSGRPLVLAQLSNSEFSVFCLQADGSILEAPGVSELKPGHAESLLQDTGRISSFELNGQLRWQTGSHTDSGAEPVFGRDGTMYLARNGIRAVERAGLTQLWAYDAGAPAACTPAVRPDGSIICALDNSDLPAGGSPGRVIALSPSGSLLWEAQLDSPAQDLTVGMGGEVFVRSGKVGYVIQPDGTATKGDAYARLDRSPFSDRLFYYHDETSINHYYESAIYATGVYPVKYDQLNDWLPVAGGGFAMLREEAGAGSFYPANTVSLINGPGEQVFETQMPQYFSGQRLLADRQGNFIVLGVSTSGERAYAYDSSGAEQYQLRPQADEQLDFAALDSQGRLYIMASIAGGGVAAYCLDRSGNKIYQRELSAEEAAGLDPRFCSLGPDRRIYSFSGDGVLARTEP